MSNLDDLWIYRFHKTLDNPTAPSEKVHMYEIKNHRTGATVFSLAVDAGEQHDIAGYLCNLHNRSLS